MTIPKGLQAKIQLHFIEIILRQFQIVSEPKLNCTSSILFYDISKLCLSRNSIASHRIYSWTIPIFVLAEVQLLPTEIVLRQFQNVF